MASINDLWKQIKPLIVDLLSGMGGGSGPFAPTPHALSGSDHTGSITDAQHGARTVANAHQHSQIGGVTADQHHAQAHAIGGADHTGSITDAQHGARTVANAHQHSQIGGVTADQHHAQVHAIGGADHSGSITDAQHGARTVANAHQHSQIGGVTADQHHAQSHVLATNAGLGADHTISGGVLGYVLRALTATTAAFQQLLHSDLGGVTADQHHAQAHAISGADHTGTLLEAQLPATAIREADAASATPETVGSTGATVGAGYLFARSNHKHIVDLAMNAVWTGLHTFQALVKTRHIEPEAGELYDIGSVLKRYRTLRVAELAATLFSKEQIMILGNKIIIAKDSDILPLAMTNVQTTYNFGRAMTPNDWIQIAAEDTAGNPSTEWIKVGTLVSGTTYNITRNVDGSGANAWSEGTPFVVIGQYGDHRIEIIAGNPATIQIIEQGATWNVNTVLNKFSKGGLEMVRSASGGTTGKLSWTTGSNIVEITDNSTLIGAIMNAIAYAPSGSSEVTLGAVVGSTGASNLRLASGAKDEATISTMKTKTPIIHADPLGALLSWPGLRMLWHGQGHNGNSATGSLLDRTGASHHLTPVNSPADAQFASGLFPAINYSNLDGTNQAFSRNNEAAFNDVNYLDILAVIEIDAIAAGTVRAVYENGATTPAWRLYINESGGVIRANFETVSSGGVSSYVNTPVTVGTRLVIRAQFVASSLFAITVNGTKATGTPAASMRAPVGSFQIGRLGAGANYFDGKFFFGGLAINGVGDATYDAAFASLRDYLGV